MDFIEKSIYFSKIEEWENWLEYNHDKVKEIWLVLYKKHTGKPSLNYNETVETALCYGWIDSLVRKIDEKAYAQKYTPRTNYKKWSESNIIRLKKLYSQNKIKQFVLEKIDISVLSGNYKVEIKSNTLDKKLESMLKSSEIAFGIFSKLPPSHKKNYINWIMDAKKPETRLKRLKEAMNKLENNQQFGLK